MAFIREQLLYDIANVAYVHADVMPTDDDHARHQVFDVIQDGNIDRVTRILDVAYAEAVELLYPFSKQQLCPLRPYFNDDTLQESDAYIIDLKLPDNFSRTTLELILRYTHEYMVARVLAQWLRIAGAPSDAWQQWYELYNDIEARIRSALNARLSRTRRTLSPF